MNLMAPLGITTRLLLEQGLDAIGICELPLATLENWLTRAGLLPQAVSWRYGGLNHLGWFWDVMSGEEDVLRLLADRPGSQRILIDKATLDYYGAAPLRYFYEVFDVEAGRRLKLERSQQRARELMALAEALIQQFAESPGTQIPATEVRPTPWLDRAVAPIASALLGGPPHSGFADLRNAGKIPELPPELVVELAATVTTGGVQPVSPGPLPGRVRSFLDQVAQSESLSFQASESRDPGLLVEAIRALPLPIPQFAVPGLARLAQRSR
jgi:6-phospho-beta-glucosidase